MTTRRVVCISDLHSGHRCGLTPPRYAPESSPEDAKFARVRHAVWEWYAATIKSLQPVYLLMVNGDATEGHGSRSGGSELVIAELKQQVEAASEAIAHAKAEHITMTYGTGYHTADESGNIDLEDLVAQKVGAEHIGAHDWPQVRGCPVVWDLAHFIGNSTVPLSVAPDLSRQQVWNAIWHEADLQPRGDWVVRSHIHSFALTCQFTDRKRWAMVTPALCGMGSKFGARRCRKLVHVGLTYWDVDETGVLSWDVLIANLPSQKARKTVF